MTPAQWRVRAQLPNDFSWQFHETFEFTVRASAKIARASRHNEEKHVAPEISPALMEKVESEAWAEYRMSASPAVRATQLRIGGGVALAVPGDPPGTLNMAVGIGSDEPVNGQLLNRIIGFYRSRGAVSAALMIAPQALPEDWAALRAELGIGDAGYATVKLAGDACQVARQGTSVARLDPGLRAGLVPAVRAREWAEAKERGFERDDPRTLEMSAGLAGLPGWQHFAVFDGDAIIATGSLHVVGNVGHLFGGATVPDSRGRGAQSALIAVRAAAACDAGCQWLMGEAIAEKPGQHNASLRNQLRAGLADRYHRQAWIWREPAGLA